MMKSLLLAYSVLFSLGYFGISNAIRMPTLPSGPYSLIILPLYTDDTNAIIAEKIKLSSIHATIEPSAVLPFLPPRKQP